VAGTVRGFDRTVAPFEGVAGVEHQPLVPHRLPGVDNVIHPIDEPLGVGEPVGQVEGERLAVGADEVVGIGRHPE